MAKPTIITRASKGSALTWTEGDANLTNLRDATLTVSDGTNSKALNLNDTLTFTAGTNVTLSVNTSTGAVTINSSNPGGTVTSVSGTGTVSGISLSGTVTGSGSLTLGGTLSLVSPPAIGSTTPNSGAFTTLSATGAVTMNPASANVTISPTGTGTVSIQPAAGLTLGNPSNQVSFASTVITANSANATYTFAPTGTGTLTLGSGAVGSIDNMNIGATTRGTGAFTTLQANSTVTFTAAVGMSPSNANVTISPTGTGTVTISPAGALTINPTAASTINNTSIGQSTAAAGSFTTLSASSTVSGTGFSTYLASPPAIGSTTASTGKFTSLQFTNTREPVFALTAGSGATTLAPDCANGSVQTFAMSTATSLTLNAFTNPVAGQSVTIIVTNNATVNTISSTMKWASGTKTLTGTANAIDIITIYYDGTNYYASVAKGFA